LPFLIPFYVLSEIYFLINEKTVSKASVVKIAAGSLSIIFAYVMLNVTQIKLIVVYLVSTIMVFSLVAFIIKVFKIKA
jgi:hypothetical protein